MAPVKFLPDGTFRKMITCKVLVEPGRTIHGTEKFVDWIKERYSTPLFQEQEEIPETKVLVPSKERIKDSVCKAYSVDIRTLFGTHRW